MPDPDQPPFELIAAKGELSGVFRIWYGAGEDDRRAFVLTLTPRYVARALHRPLPITLAQIQNYARKNKDHLAAIARSEKERGRKALVLE
jgi:hypothetical protein